MFVRQGGTQLAGNAAFLAYCDARIFFYILNLGAMLSDNFKL